MIYVFYFPPEEKYLIISNQSENAEITEDLNDKGKARNTGKDEEFCKDLC